MDGALEAKILTHNARLEEFNVWLSDFKTYHSGLDMDQFSLKRQRLYLTQCMDETLKRSVKKVEQFLKICRRC